MKQAVLSVFDCTSLATAYKSLWDNCEDDLSLCGLTFHQRRTSEKRQAADAFLADILTAFDKLDTSDKLPAIICEANDLIKLPCLVSDPISVKLDSQTNTLNSLADKIQHLPSLTSHPSDVIDKSCSALDKVVGDLKVQLSKFSSSIASFSLAAEKVCKVSHFSDSAGVSQTNPTVSARPLCSFDRSNNIILFGLPELPLLSMKSAIDDMSIHLIGKVVRVIDAFRLGRKPDASSQARPRPVLIKLENCWDKRLLLAACRKLKGYSDHKLFIREDLPPEARISRRASSVSRPGSPGEPGISEPASNSLSTSNSVDSSNVRSSNVVVCGSTCVALTTFVSVAITAEVGDLALIMLLIYYNLMIYV